MKKNDTDPALLILGLIRIRTVYHSVITEFVLKKFKHEELADNTNAKII